MSTRKLPSALIRRLGLQATYCYFVKHRGAAYARGENRLLTSAFNMRSIMYGQGMWIGATKALEPLLEGSA